MDAQESGKADIACVPDAETGKKRGGGSDARIPPPLMCVRELIS